jgi:hypothetical protein
LFPSFSGGPDGEGLALTEWVALTEGLAEGLALAAVSSARARLARVVKNQENNKAAKAAVVRISTRFMGFSTAIRMPVIELLGLRQLD